MRRVTGHAAFSLDRSMLESKWARFIRVAIKAELILCVGRPQLMRKETAVRVVAIAASDKPFIHLVVEWLGEIGFNVKMTGEAQLWLLDLQEPGLNFGRVNGMGVNAADIILEVL